LQTAATDSAQLALQGTSLIFTAQTMHGCFSKFLIQRLPSTQSRRKIMRGFGREYKTLVPSHVPPAEGNSLQLQVSYILSGTGSAQEYILAISEFYS